MLQPNPIGIDGVLITWVFMATALATGIWLLTRGSTLVKFDVILWFVALWVARLLTHLGPAQSQPPGQKFYSSILGPPITLVVAGVVMVIAWVVQKHRKTGATQ